MRVVTHSADELAPTLVVAAGQCSETGAKAVNEDSCGIRIPEEPLLYTKGIGAVIADGASGSEAGREASETCVQGFLADYYATPESWSVKTSVERVLGALNRWLYGQGQREHGTGRGLVTTLSLVIVKSTTAYLFHVGDTRIYRLRGGTLEPLTRDHQVQVAGDRRYLSRAMGVDLRLEIDYRTLTVEPGDLFLLTTDGVHAHVSDTTMAGILADYHADLEAAARAIVAAAVANGSPDNVTCQVLRVERLPTEDDEGFFRRLTELPFPPPLEAGQVLDGYRILRELHASKRTQIYLALDVDSQERVILKTPSVTYEDDPVYIDRFLHEEWAARRIHSPHVLAVVAPRRPRTFLYYVTEHLEGETLRQWMTDHPQPSLAEVRGIVEQIGAGLRAFHHLEMLHQDLKPENLFIDGHGTVKIIDFGSTKIAGVEEIATPLAATGPLGTVNYTAPEYLRGGAGSNRSDIYSLGVIAYELLTGKLPYGDQTSLKSSRERPYRPATDHRPDVPAWVDGALRKAVQREPHKRYEALSELVYDLSHPNAEWVTTDTAPLLQHNPVVFWRGLALILLVTNALLAVLLLR
jgi:serine/threonine protein phosphatase PrpC